MKNIKTEIPRSKLRRFRLMQMSCFVPFFGVILRYYIPNEKY